MCIVFGIMTWSLVYADLYPYKGVSGFQVIEYVKDGGRPMSDKQLVGKNVELYLEIMKNAWSANPAERRDFKEIRNMLEKGKSSHPLLSGDSDLEEEPKVTPNSSGNIN